MLEFLIFQLSGLMASWGTIACGKQRKTYSHPTKSAILGLIGAALGIDRDDSEQQEKLNHGLQLAVEVFRYEHFLVDYHTTQTAAQSEIKQLKKQNVNLTRKDELSPKKLNTVLSDREYWLDVYYRVAIQIPEFFPWNLTTIQNALRYPKFHLYLGRKSCPVNLPLNPLILSAPEVVTAFNLAEAQLEIPCYFEQDFIKKKCDIFSDQSLISNTTGYKSYLRRDIPANRKQWEFSPREEIMLLGRRASVCG